jgi:hypothetical protein
MPTYEHYKKAEGIISQYTDSGIRGNMSLDNSKPKSNLLVTLALAAGGAYLVYEASK